MQVSSPAPSIPGLLTDPRLFLHRIDAADDTMILVEASTQSLRDTVFLDGRTTFWQGSPIPVPLSRGLRNAGAVQSSAPDRCIFHVSFCGSTLLAGLVDAEAAFVLKEPHALVDLADWDVAGRCAADHADDRDLDLALALTCDLLKRPRLRDRPVVIKPSNWVNALLPRLVRTRPDLRPLFLTMEREAFLIAVFRGGRDRLAFTARIAALLAAVLPRGQDRMRQAEAGAADPLGQVANLVVLAHAFQIELFENAMATGGWGLEHRLDFADLTADPSAALGQACRALDLPTGPDAIASAVASRAGIHAKQPEAVFSQTLRACEDAEVRAAHGTTLDAALDWARRTLDS